MRLITIAILTMLAMPALAATPTPMEQAKATLKDLEKQVYKARILQEQTSSHLRRLKNETTQTKILEHKTETKPEREARISEESNERLTSTITNVVLGLLSLILSFFGLGKWRDMSLKTKMQKAWDLAHEVWALAEASNGDGKQKKKIATDMAEARKKTEGIKDKHLDLDHKLAVISAKDKLGKKAVEL